MGNRSSQTKEIKFVLLGPEGSGKTTMFYHMKHGEIVSTVPSIGVEFETVYIDGIDVACWDIGTFREGTRVFWRLHYCNAQGLVFVIDSSDLEILDEAISDLISYVFQGTTIKNKIVMVVANKQDKEGALSAQEIEDALAKRYPIQKIKSFVLLVVPCSALDGKQVTDIFSYLARLMCLNETGKLKRGLISMKEQQEPKKSKSDSADTELVFKTCLKHPVRYLTKYFKSGDLW